MHRTPCIALRAFLVALAAMAASGSLAEDGPSYQISASIHRIHASLSGETSLTEDIGILDEAGNPSAVQGPYTFFTRADLKLGSLRFRLDDEGVTWNGEKDLPVKGDVETLARPQIISAPGQQAEIVVGRTDPYQYMERLEDGRFELKSSPLVFTGLRLRETIVSERDGRVRIEPLEVEMSAVKEREPIPGVDLPVGKPIPSTDLARLALTLPLDRPLGILWRAKQGMVLVVVKVSRVGR